MKILHTSDWHLGQNFMGQSRAEEHEAFLAWLIGVIKEQEVDILVVAGDIYDTGTPPNYAQRIYYDFLKELASIESLTTIITAGNHDSVSTLKTSKELLELLDIHVIASGGEGEEELLSIVRGEELRAIICAVPYLRDSIVRDSVSGESVHDKESLYNQGIKAHYRELHDQAQELRGERDIPIIATGHLTTVGSRSSESEREIYIGGTLDIGGDYLGEMFDYVALGHLHISQTVGFEHVRYSGSPIPLSFSEATTDKKINIVTFEGRAVAVEELHIPQIRTLIRIKGDLEHIEKSLKEVEDRGAWIEISIRDDNPSYANRQIREVASKLDLTLLAVKIEKSQKELEAKELKAISLDELSILDLFIKRVELEELQSDRFRQELIDRFKQVVERVEQR